MNFASPPGGRWRNISLYMFTAFGILNLETVKSCFAVSIFRFARIVQYLLVRKARTVKAAVCACMCVCVCVCLRVL
jgi:hypothetical protein